MENQVSWKDDSVQKQYESGLNYQSKMQFGTKFVEQTNFKEGKQWPDATENTKNMPRPVFNMIRFILNHKKASVNNENIKMIYTPQEMPDDNMMDEQIIMAAEGSYKFTKFSETTWENIEQDAINEDALEDAATNGSCHVHYYWDSSIKGGITTQFIGEMQGEVIDPLSIFYGNPQCIDVQKQPYIIISKRELVTTVQEEAKANGVPLEFYELLKADNNTANEKYDSARTELNDGEKVTVLIKYWKEKDGVVYFKKVCNSIVFKPNTPTGFKLYPIASFSWERRKKCIYGIGECEGLIPNQRAINFLIAMSVLSAQNVGWPKILVKSDALRQPITNTPGEILTDYSTEVGDGIKYMNPAAMNDFVGNLVTQVMDFTRTLTGASEVATGDPFSKQLNAAAIIALQNQAKIPIEQIKKRYYRFLKDIAKIWEEFFKVKYNTTRNVVVKDSEGKDMPMEFNGSLYADYPMNLKIDIGASSSFSESLMMTSLDKFLDKGLITFEQYLKYAPETTVPFKDQLLKDIQMNPPMLHGQMP